MMETSLAVADQGMRKGLSNEPQKNSEGVLFQLQRNAPLDATQLPPQ
jgi:hypothetical protein